MIHLRILVVAGGSHGCGVVAKSLFGKARCIQLNVLQGATGRAGFHPTIDCVATYIEAISRLAHADYHAVVMPASTGVYIHHLQGDMALLCQLNKSVIVFYFHVQLTQLTRSVKVGAGADTTPAQLQATNDAVLHYRVDTEIRNPLCAMEIADGNRNLDTTLLRAFRHLLSCNTKFLGLPHGAAFMSSTARDTSNPGQC